MNRAEKEAKKVLEGNQKPEMHQLYTQWGQSVQEKEECPCPQFLRPGRLPVILHGRWQYAIRAEVSEIDSWDGEIQVPFSPETVMSGVGRTLSPEEYLFYRKTFDISELEASCTCLLHFDAVDQECSVSLNGSLLGEHAGGNLSFSFDVSDVLKAGENVLTLIVRDRTEQAPYSRGKQKFSNQGPLSSIFYPCQSGIWKSVWLETRPKAGIRGVNMDPCYDSSEIEVTVTGTEEGELYSVSVFESVLANTDEYAADCHTMFEHTRPIIEYGGRAGSALRIPLPKKNLRSWTPQEPWLYPVRIRMGDDVLETYFGMRSISLEKDEKGITRIMLNHQQIFLNGVLDQGYWPESLMTAPCDEALLYDIRKMKALGYNTLRKHVKVEEERFYYHCDRLGMMVIQDMPNGGGDYNMYFQAYLPNFGGNLVRSLSDRDRRRFAREDEAGREHFLEELREMIRQLGSHPSIVMWVPFNEGWGQFDAAEVSKLVKAWDPSRLVNEACGWFDQGGGDLYSIHNYFRKLSVKPQGDRAVALTEYGGFACPVQEHMWNEESFGYRHYNHAVEVTAAYEKLWKEQILPAIPRGLCCAIYTQVSDICEENNGLMTWDREVDKVIVGRMQQVHAKV